MSPQKSSKPWIRKLLILGAAAGLFLATAPASAEVPYEVILQSSNPSSSLIVPTVLALRSQSELETLWRRLGRSIAPPQVDFKRHTMVVYFLGRRASSGYRLEVERIGVRAGTLMLSVVESTPGDCCVSAQTGTSPAIWVTTIPWKGPVDAELRSEPRNCCE